MAKKTPSPRSHLDRLALLLVVCLVAFLIIKDLATPASWNYEVWYRGDALAELQALPLAFGGNESCVECHDDEHEAMAEFKHQTLACESCHGALADHVKEGKKFADAKVDKSRTQCLLCHQVLISRPKDFPQFSMDIRRHKTMKETTVCVKCHDPHEPAI